MTIIYEQFLLTKKVTAPPQENIFACFIHCFVH